MKTALEISGAVYGYSTLNVMKLKIFIRVFRVIRELNSCLFYNFRFFRIWRGMVPHLEVRACVRTLSPPNLDILTLIPKDANFLSYKEVVPLSKLLNKLFGEHVQKTVHDFRIELNA
jgi:hypothetical protein